SPENIMLTFDGGVKLVDFGIAKARASAERLSRAGKLPYMAPEQVSAGSIEARTDIYAMGVVLYELVAGRKPFPSGLSPEELTELVAAGRFTPVRQANPAVPEELEQIIARAMARAPEARFESAEE